MRAARVATTIVAVLGLWCAGFAAPDLHLGLLYLTPALLLAIALLSGRFPGEQLLERAARRLAGVARRPPAASPGVPHDLLILLPRGGLLLARCLAGRAPPCLAA